MAKGQSRPRTPKGGGESRSGTKICFSVRVRVRVPSSAPSLILDDLFPAHNAVAMRFHAKMDTQIPSLQRNEHLEFQLVRVHVALRLRVALDRRVFADGVAAVGDPMVQEQAVTGADIVVAAV